MKEIPFYQIDAFARDVFSGNPAGVCLLDEWPADAVLQSIAMENNLPETAFLVRQEEHYELRWFSPKVEIDLCGHATLASGFVIFNYIDPGARYADFSTKSGKLTVTRDRDLLVMDFPARKPVPAPPPPDVEAVFGVAPVEVLGSRDLLLVFREEETIKSMKPDLSRVAALDYFAAIVTAPGRECDFVSRFFAPGAGIPEDPVTGSAHCSLIPYWAERLGKKELYARQLSERGGELFCKDQGGRVAIGGRAVTYLAGTIKIPDGPK